MVKTLGGVLVRLHVCVCVQFKIMFAHCTLQSLVLQKRQYRLYSDVQCIYRVSLHLDAKDILQLCTYSHGIVQGQHRHLSLFYMFDLRSPMYRQTKPFGCLRRLFLWTIHSNPKWSHREWSWKLSTPRPKSHVWTIPNIHENTPKSPKAWQSEASHDAWGPPRKGSPTSCSSRAICRTVVFQGGGLSPWRSWWICHGDVQICLEQEMPKLMCIYYDNISKIHIYIIDIDNYRYIHKDSPVVELSCWILWHCSVVTHPTTVIQSGSLRTFVLPSWSFPGDPNNQEVSPWARLHH